MPMQHSKRSLERSSTTVEVDLDALIAREPAALAALRRAARGSGALLLHGATLDARLMRDVRALATRAFRLPPEDLAAIDMAHSPHFRGYSCVGSERTQGRADLREQLDFAPERPPDPRARDGAAYRRLPGPNQWPAALPALRPAILAWMTHLNGVAVQMLDALLAAIGAAPDAFGDAFAPDPFTRLKIVRYPGMAEPDAQGVGPHRDSGAVTLILDDGSGGLRVRDGEREVEVRAPHDALIVVFGRTVERATGGYVTAAHHDVVSPPAGAERISIPYFFSPRLDYVVAPIALPPAIAAAGRARDIDSADAGTSAYGESALNVLLRSHPTVAERHHPDLLAPR
jgi:isopenicillin N synthase-like dioxygenase